MFLVSFGIISAVVEEAEKTTKIQLTLELVQSEPTRLPARRALASGPGRFIGPDEGHRNWNFSRTLRLNPAEFPGAECL